MFSNETLHCIFDVYCTLLRAISLSQLKIIAWGVITCTCLQLIVV